MGHYFGVPFHASLQKQIILMALIWLETAKQSGDIYLFPKTRVRARREAREIERILELKKALG